MNTASMRNALFVFLLLGLAKTVVGFHISMSSKLIYGVKNSGWTSPEWNWGYARGTGHDCAAICRQQYATAASRSELVKNLYEAPNVAPEERKPSKYEEVKLTLALAWQRGRWDGSDGGRGGYGEVLAAMASASRYEAGNEDECSIRLIEDMQQRFHLLNPKTDDLNVMGGLIDEHGDDLDAARRKCCALVLDAMGFVSNGL